MNEQELYSEVKSVWRMWLALVAVCILLIAGMMFTIHTLERISKLEQEMEWVGTLSHPKDDSTRQDAESMLKAIEAEKTFKLSTNGMVGLTPYGLRKAAIAARASELKIRTPDGKWRKPETEEEKKSALQVAECNLMYDELMPVKTNKQR